MNQTDAFKQIKDDVVIVYPTPTVWSTHTLMALDEKGDTLLNLLKTPAAQKLAWERHGFRAANFAGTDSISRFGVAGTLDQIPAVSELPNNDAMQHLITTLQSAQAKLVADISMYDTMYTQNAQQYRELKMTVLAGKKALADFNANQLPALEAEAAASGDAMQAQVLKDFKSKLDRFAKRLDDLDRISVVTLQTAPQIKIIQNADQTIVDKIDTTISTTIPVWKSQMVIALGLSNQRKVLDLQNKADDVTNKLLARNAAALHKGAVDAEKANQRSVVEIDTLEKINAELIATLKETVQIQKEGEANREAAQVKMRQIESDGGGDVLLDFVVCMVVGQCTGWFQATSPSWMRLSMMLMPYSVLMRLSRYQTMYSSSIAVNSSIVTPRKLLLWKNSCLRRPKNPSAAALSGEQPFALIDRVSPCSVQMRIHSGHR